MKENKSKRLLFYILMFLIPLFLIAGTEIFLRIINYGVDYSAFVELEESPGQYFINPELPKKYFSANVEIPSVIPDPFDKVKDKETYRIFVLGGSSTAGYPYPPNASFPRILKRKLEMFYPETKFEVVNLGVSAVNSYFIRDIIGDIIDKQPDLIIIYAGHNEFYGALGPASTQFIGGSPWMIDLILDLREYKLYQLTANSISGLFSVFSSGDAASGKTLMGEMVAENQIPLGSAIYQKGVEQFRENLEFIYQSCKENNVNIIVSNLVSNLKQRPLEFNSKEAADIFSEAEDLLKMGERKEAKKLFMRAKETDKLRFRAPHAFNDVINVLLKDNEIIKIDSIFYSKSEKGITGFDLFVDHLHPNLKGYKLMADAFFEKIESDIRRKKISGVSPESIENYLDKNFPMTRFDSTFSRIKIDILLNSFPFTERTDYNPADFKTENFADTVAMKAVKGEMGWASSHLMLFNYFMRKNEFKKAFSELYTLMEARPFYKSALKNSIAKMLEKNRLYDAKHILVRNHRRYPDAFTSKNLGIINLKQGNISLAERLLKEASSYNPEDAEIQFLLARAQYAGRKVDQAIASMETCLKLNPEYPNAKGILQKLRNIKSKR